MAVNILCSYIPSVAVKLDEIDADIYNESIFNKAMKFISQRYQLLLKECLECEILMICKGGCLMGGIDSSNKINPAACAFNKEVWKCFLERMEE